MPSSRFLTRRTRGSRGVLPTLMGSIAMLLIMAGPPLEAQRKPPEPEVKPDTDNFKPSILTQKDARTFNFTVPAPRGQILDRFGHPLANSVVAHHLALRLSEPDRTSEADMLANVNGRIAIANRILNTRWKLPDKTILDHFANRRWFPLRISPRPLDPAQIKSLQPLLAPKQGASDGFVLEPIYLRNYPGGRSAAHIIGYVGRETPLETGEIRDMELLFEDFEGRAGLEQTFNKDLTGRDGVVNMTFDASGGLAAQSVIQAPEPGYNVVTTLNLELQKLSEDALSRHARRGALVLIDADTGDIFAMASHPGFDPNDFVPFISRTDFDALNNHPDAPLFGRAFSAAYPPGSTFKPIASCAMLERGIVTPHTSYDGPPGLNIDGRVFHNWNKNPEGMLTVVGALARSCNTWFYQAAIDTGSAPIVQTALQLGFARPLGLPIPGEAAGSLPKEYLSRQATANLTIGQGEVTCTPVQLAFAIGAIANGRNIPQPRLVMQIQDFTNKVLRQDKERTRGYLPFSTQTVQTVQLGMDEVVNSNRGTATRARHEHPMIAAKTGTAQWGEVNGVPKHLGLFTGFTFSSNPKIVFVSVYEGNPGERVGGSSKAAPIIKDVIDAIYADPAKYGLSAPLETNRPEPVAGDGFASGFTARGVPVQGGEIPPGPAFAPGYLPPVPAPLPDSLPPPQSQPKEKRGFFKRLFGN